MTHTEELVTNFLTLLKTERPLLDDALKMLTVTQQHEYKYVGGVDVKATINGLYGLVRQSESFEVFEKPSSNKMVKDVKIVLRMTYEAEKISGFKSRKLTCRCVKESDVRKPNIDGVWGINVSSFKFVDGK